MKKLLFTVLTTCLIGFTANAQYQKNAIGVRLGGGNVSGGEISFQRALGDNNRLELDLGIGGNDFVNAFRLVGIYQWVWNIEGGFNWYAGFGAGVGIIDYNDRYYKNDPFRDDDRLFVSIDGQIGIEYIFTEAPIQLALDLRPSFFIVNDYYRGRNYGDVAFSIRYQFD